MYRQILIFILILSLMNSCQTKKTNSTESTIEDDSTDIMPQNVLTDEEELAGWRLLFDGVSTSSWHRFNRDGIGSGWIVSDGVLWLDPSKKDGGDIVTNETFENFELSLQWKIQECGNSGIMWNVIEGVEYDAPWRTGPEMQILDDSCHTDGKIEKHRTGDLYDLIESSEVTVKPTGEWNTVRIIQNDDSVQFWLNGVNVVSFTMHDEAWDEMVAQSKFKDMPGFGKFKKGKISLQDHGDIVSFRNIKIKTTNPPNI